MTSILDGGELVRFPLGARNIRPPSQMMVGVIRGTLGVIRPSSGLVPGSGCFMVIITWSFAQEIKRQTGSCLWHPAREGGVFTGGKLLHPAPYRLGFSDDDPSTPTPDSDFLQLFQVGLRQEKEVQAWTEVKRREDQKTLAVFARPGAARH